MDIGGMEAKRMFRARSSNLWGGIAILLVLLSIGSSATHAKTIHVKVGGTGDGSSWANAYGSLQPALDDADPNDSIWVGEGTYVPMYDYGLDIGDRGKHFRMKNGVGIYGGFPAEGSPGLEDRDWEEYETVLSGDLLGNDVEVDDPCDLIDEPSREDNCLHIFYNPEGVNLDPNAVLDGFVLTGGNADWTRPPELPRHDWGGGVYTNSSSPTMANCAFTNNTARVGGGVAFEATPWAGIEPTVTNCTFYCNAVTQCGGGIAVGNNSRVMDCRFSNNYADNWGAGLYNSDGRPEVIDCTFTGNSARYYGGAIHNYSGSPHISDCIIRNNSVEKWGGGISNWYGSSARITGCIISNNWADEAGGGCLNRGTDAATTILNTVFCRNNTLGSGGGLYNRQSSPNVGNCTFFGNVATGAGGGMYNFWDSHPRVNGCILRGNMADADLQIHDSEGGAGQGPASSVTVTYSNIKDGWEGIGNIDADPCFADPDNGDYHLKSQGGRYDPTTQSWVYDEVTGLCIDAGNPMSSIGVEPFPNGGIINIGAYGGTTEASKSYFGKPPCEIIVAGDINGDCEVNFLDFRLMGLHWCEDNNL